MPASINATVIIAGVIVLVALILDFTNGFHDAANSIASVVSTRVLSPRDAVIWAAIFNFVALPFLEHASQDNWRRSGAHAVLATAALFDLHLGEKARCHQFRFMWSWPRTPQLRWARSREDGASCIQWVQRLRSCDPMAFALRRPGR